MRKLLVAALALALLVGGAAFESPAHAQIPDAGQASLWTCSLDDIGATLTRCAIAHTDTAQTMYVTTVVAQSTTTTAGNFILRYGTGTNCGTDTRSLLPSAATAARLAAPASTAAPTVISLASPLKIPAGKDLCVLGVATNTFTGQISGFYGAP